MSKDYLRIQYRNYLLDLKLNKPGALDALRRTIELATLIHGFRFADELKEMSHEYGF